MSSTTNEESSIAIIGGSGLYDIDGVENLSEHRVETPYGPPSDLIIQCEVSGRKVFFLPRHARGHTILPHELNHRANFWALKSLGVNWAVSVTAVGSLQECYAPRDIVLPDQFFDRTSRREEHTFFGEGICAHIAFGEPISHNLRGLLFETASAIHERKVHNGGTYVNMDGPAFSTRAESLNNQRLGFDVIGMTNLPEAKLARESEIALATMSMITDYDCWKVEEEPVTAEIVIGHLQANAESAKKIIKELIPKIPENPDWPEHHSLDGAIIGDSSSWPEKTRVKLEPILSRYLNNN
ncbi:MAG: methylthioadenosine phosphorylase [Verrucomicrobiaceae bacterium TMED76]|nr:MAG: methylthioadenosine phosphorylase [Verrucomicrobiaceae bacterium TMED76]